MLVDIPNMEDSTKGKALDMAEASPIQGFDASIIGTANEEDTKESNPVIITVEITRKPGSEMAVLIMHQQFP